MQETTIMNIKRVINFIKNDNTIGYIKKFLYLVENLDKLDNVYNKLKQQEWIESFDFNNYDESNDEQYIIDFINGNINDRTHIASKINKLIKNDVGARSLARNILCVDHIPDYIIPMYSINENGTPYVIGDEDGITRIDADKTFTVPIFDITHNVHSSSRNVKSGVYSLLKTMRNLCSSQILVAESMHLLSLINASYNDDNEKVKNIMSINDKLTPDVISDAFSIIEDNDVEVSSIIINPNDYSEIRKFNGEILDTDFNTNNVIKSRIWGANVFVTGMATAGTITVLGSPKHVGAMPIRTDITSLPYDNPEQRKIGFNTFENIGIMYNGQKNTVRITL